MKTKSIIHTPLCSLAFVLLVPALPACDPESDGFESDRLEPGIASDRFAVDEDEADDEAECMDEAEEPGIPLQPQIDELGAEQDSMEKMSCCAGLSGCIATAKSEGHPWLYDDCIDALGDCCVAEMAQ